MYTWFQDLNESGRYWFNFRGSFGRSWDKILVEYQFASGPALSLKMTAKKHKTSFVFGLGFFSIYLTVRGLVMPFLTKPRQYGFYWHDWTLWAFFGQKEWESSSNDPWYYKITFSPLDVLFGKTEYFKREVMKSWDPQYFLFRGKEYKMDSIVIEDAFWFRPRIPFSLYRKQLRCMDLKIDAPPGRAGKGENSWDCGDAATSGLSRGYEGPEVTWKNQKEVFEHCVRMYCDHVMGDIKKYGRASNDDYHRLMHGFQFIGRKPSLSENSGEQLAEEVKQ